MRKYTNWFIVFVVIISFGSFSQTTKSRYAEKHPKTAITRTEVLAQSQNAMELSKKAYEINRTQEELLKKGDSLINFLQKKLEEQKEEKHL